MNILIKNAFIINGSGEEGFYGSVVIENDKITEVLDYEPNGEYNKVIDAKSKVVCSGFIDTHSHSDLKILENLYQEPKILQGITTEVLGQDGISMSPLPKKFINDWQKNLAGLDGQSDIISWDYPTTDKYLSEIEDHGTANNIAYLIPHGNVRLEAIGINDRKATNNEIETMKKIVHREMEAGAIGLSTGLIYIPCAYADLTEIIEMCKVVAEFGGVFVVHQRSEAELILSSMDEIFKIGIESGVKIHFSHFKACGKKTWKLVPQILEKLDNAKAMGITVSFDQYPYVAGSTILSVVMPPWVQNEGMNKMLEKLQDEEQLTLIEKEILREDCLWDNFFDFAGPENILITYVGSDKNQNLIGKSITEISDIWGISPVRTAAKLIVEEKNAVSMVDFYGTEEHVKLFLQREEQNVCTDGLLSGMPHPRVYGAFPRVLGKYVRQENALTLEQAVRKMTKKAADAMGIVNRGMIEKNYFADIVIFDKDKIIDKGDYKNPRQSPLGIEMVMVNGKVVFKDGEKYYANSGKVLRRNQHEC